MSRVDYRAAMLLQPLWFFAMVLGIKDMALGLAFVLGLPYALESKIYVNFDSLLPGTTGLAMGWLLLVLGVWKVAVTIIGRMEWARWPLEFASFTWLFSTIIYVAQGEWMLGIAIPLTFSLMSGYLAFMTRDGVPLDRVYQSPSDSTGGFGFKPI